MSLTGRTLEVIDTLDMLVIDKSTKKTMFSAVTTKAGLQQKTTAIDIWAGISSKHLSKLRAKKEITVSGSIAAFDLDFLASANGVPLEDNTTGTLYFGQPNSVSSLASTIAGAQMVYSVQRITGEFLTLVNAVPTSLSEVQVTYNTGAIGTKQVEKLTVTSAPTSSGSITVSFNDGIVTSKTVTLSSTTDTTTSLVASKIASAFSSLNGWVVTSSSADVIFTKSSPVANLNVTISATDTGSTGVGSLTGTQVTPGVATTTSGANLTFYSGFADNTVNVTFKALPSGNGKDSKHIVFNATAFPKNAEVLLKGVAYDTETQEICADVKVHFYKCALSPDFNMNFEMNKAIDTPVSLDVLIPETIPTVIDGVLTEVVNTDGDLGDMFVDER